MKNLLLCVLGLSLSALLVRAQDGAAQEQDGLVLRSVVQSVNYEEDRSSNYVIVSLRSEFINTGPTPVILLKRKPVFTGLELSRSSTFALEDVVVRYGGGPSLDGDPRWEGKRKALNKESPPPDLTDVIMPNATLSFDSKVTISCPKQPSPGMLYRPSLSELESMGPLWLRVFYEVWPLNIEPNVLQSRAPEFGRVLQRKWQTFGMLRLDEVRTEPIMLNLKRPT